MKSKVQRRGLKTVNRTLTGILAAAMVMSNVSGTGLVVQAEEGVLRVNTTEEASEEETSIEITTAEESESEELTTEESISEEAATEEATSEKLSKEEAATEEMTTESMTSEETSTEEVTIEELTTEETTVEESTTEEISIEELSGEEALFASVYLQFDSKGGTCDISMLELTPDNMELELPQPQKAGYRFTGWYMDAECTIAFEEENIFWEAGSTYILFAGYEQLLPEEIVLVEKTLQQSIQGVTISVEGNMPAEATLEVRAEALTPTEQENIVEESDIVDSATSLYAEENNVYSYDISICYQDVEYEPYIFDEMVQVTFSFENTQELQEADQLEVFHIDDSEKVEKIEIKEVSDNEVCFEADAFSTYILITKVEYTGNKNWTYGFTGDVQTFTAPVSGQYVFECYGAGISTSKGSFAKGTVGLEKGEMVYIYVGGQNNTFNGGGAGGAVWHSASNSGGSFNQNVHSSNGCGATDVRVGSGYDSRLIVAGGGAGNGNCGGVNYSYNGSHVSDGPTYYAHSAINQVSSNDVLGKGSDYETWVNSGVWGTGDSYPDRGTYSIRVVTGGGGGGYYGGNSGYAGTSKVISKLEYQGKEYSASDYEIETLVYEGEGKCLVSLYSLQADVITYYNYNMTKLGETAGLTGSYVNFPAMQEAPVRNSDNKYDYIYCGWDDMATEEIEYYSDEQTIALAMNGDRNYIAAYECIGKSYAVILDSADAQNAGTTGIIATYHSTLPDITIPVKEGSVFDGYFTEQNGNGLKIYTADGKGNGLSEMEQETTLYAHWVQPITNVKSPENKEILAGYAGVVLTTEIELCQPTGYALNYQWYINYENSIVTGNPIEEADGKKLVIPQGFQPGEYYFYCLITATNVLNSQAVSVFTTPSKITVEKGIIGMEQIEVETKECIYDDTSKALRAAINNSNPYRIYYSEIPLTAENYQAEGSTEPKYYTDAGSYTSYIYVTGTDFADFSGSITMTIQKAEPHVYLSSKNTAYNGMIQTIDAARVYDVNDREMEMLVAYVYFQDEACTRKTDSSCGALSEGGAPSAVGTYYVHAITQETNNYHDVATKTPAMFNILGTNVKYSISSYHGKYDGKPHGLQIVNENTANATIYFSDSVELTKDNYQIAGTVMPFEYTEIGRYPIYYLVETKLAGGINQYETGMAEIVIEEAVWNNGGSNSGNNSSSDEPDDNQDTSNDTPSGTQNNKQDKTENEKHKHNYELMSFEEPTSEKEGMAVYRCTECGHELVIHYPATGEVEELPKEQETAEKKNEQKEPEKIINNTTKDKVSIKKESTKEVTEDKIEETTKELSEEVRKALTEAELLRLAETLKGLTETEIRDLHEKGFLTLTGEELERLLAMIRTQIIIDEEKVSLSETWPSEGVDESTANVDKNEEQGKGLWNVIWAFILGAIVMFCIREILGIRNRRRGEQASAPTRRLN